VYGVENRKSLRECSGFKEIYAALSFENTGAGTETTQCFHAHEDVALGTDGSQIPSMHDQKFFFEKQAIARSVIGVRACLMGRKLHLMGLLG
jgi:hypothetical protein